MPSGTQQTTGSRPDTPIPVVDAHLHLWDPDRFEYPWLRQVPALRRSYLPADLTTATANLATSGFRLDAAVVVEAGRSDARAHDEVRWIEQLAADWPSLQAVVAHLPVEHGDRAADRLAALRAHPLVTGIRRNVQDEPAGFLRTDAFLRGVRLLRDCGLTFDLCVRHHQLAEVTSLVAQVPEVTFVLDHLGKPPVATESTGPDDADEPDDMPGGPGPGWRDELARLAQLPNVVCKLSGLATEAGTGWRGADLVPYLAHALAVFGPDRCLFGGDWPVATLATGYRRWLGVVHAACAGLSESQRRAVFAGNAQRIYRIT
ncbi:amidohydrolase family protein [Solwaraspora sp. WMMD406]|uniref:amidohydrolase family protein n=1 Tax=Solwaraspora sp. WMMD406 TaxID=3016095 RepID=UPI002417DD2A|nr:amidohydrolase family protein [Solwaraspora sp. WMMD406]MDG4765704.1 amidohydrolase family protein [Solwaraspora sp. WMMD406]